MSFWRPDIYWTDTLRWYERIGVATWWLGQAAFAVSIMAAIGLIAAALYRPLAGTSNSMVLESALVLLLVGIVTLVGARLVLGWLIRDV